MRLRGLGVGPCGRHWLTLGYATGAWLGALPVNECEALRMVERFACSQTTYPARQLRPATEPVALGIFAHAGAGVRDVAGVGSVRHRSAGSRESAYLSLRRSGSLAEWTRSCA